MHSEERTILATTLLEAGQKLLNADVRGWQVESDSLTSAGSDASVVASIGLSGSSGVKGALVLGAKPEFFVSVYPAELRAGISNEGLLDWAAELTNQLLGRIKNQLLRRGLDFSLGIPTVVRGERLRITCFDRPNCVEYRVMVGTHRLDLHFEIAREDGGPLFSEEAIIGAAGEGDTLLF